MVLTVASLTSMASLAIFSISLIKKIIPDSFRYISSIPELYPPPPKNHIYLDAAFTKHFKEVLVIGDVHGCCDELQELLSKAEANSDDILKVYVGDLVNKGPKNQEVLNLVRPSKSSLSVRGNHDELVLREYYQMKSPMYKVIPENEWIKDLTEENVQYLVDLPYSISILPSNALIVHAGLVPGLSLELQDLRDLIYTRNIVSRDYFWDGGLQATHLDNVGEPWASVWGGPQHVYFGHDAKRLLQLYPKATGLDTGCVYGKKLTGVFISGPRQGSFVEAIAKKMHQKPLG